MKLRDVNTKNKVMISKERIPFLNIHPISTPTPHITTTPSF